MRYAIDDQMELTLDDVDEFGGVREDRLEETARLDGAALGGHAGALHLLVQLVEILSDAGLGRHAARGFERAEPLDLAPSLLEPASAVLLVLLLLLAHTIPRGAAAVAQEEEGKGRGEQCCRRTHDFVSITYDTSSN